MTQSPTPAQSKQKGRSPKNPPATSEVASQPANTPASGTNAQVRFVGLDVHKRQITYCILDGAGTTLREGEIVLTREQLADFASKVLTPTDQDRQGRRESPGSTAAVRFPADSLAAGF